MRYRRSKNFTLSTGYEDEFFIHFAIHAPLWDRIVSAYHKIYPPLRTSE